MILTCPTPSTINPLNPNGFLFSISKLPELTFFVQEVELPAISLGVALQTSSIHDIKVPGETMEFSDLTVSFLVDEQFANYKAIYAWMTGLGFPERNQMYRDWLETQRNKNDYTELAKGYSDASLTILDSSNNILQQIMYVDAFPISLSGISFNAKNADAPVVQASCTFAYTYYTLS